MQTLPNLTDHLLIAMPSLADPNFSRTVTYICEHNEQGAMGVVINRPLEITLEEMFSHLEIAASPEVDLARHIGYGGPVQPEHGFVLHRPRGAWDSSLPISDAITITTSRDVLRAIAHNEGPSDYLIVLGYAGWGPGQLEQEMSDNAWLYGPSEPRLLFDLPASARWNAAAALLGIDLNLLSTDVGHA